MDNIIKIIEGYPGVGKTSWAIQEINRSKNKRYLFITPYLDEIKRIKRDCVNVEFFDPKERNNTKVPHFMELLYQGENIVTTHELFKRTNTELLSSALCGKNYTLIIDETPQVIYQYDPAYYDSVFPNTIGNKQKIIAEDLNKLQQQKTIKIEENGKVSLLNKEAILHPYRNFAAECEKGRMYYIDDAFMMWIFPACLFSTELFDEIFIMTHRFESQTQSYFFKYYDIPYELFYIYKDSENYLFTDDQNYYKEPEWKQEVAKYLNILKHEGLNTIDQIRKTRYSKPERSLSFSWYENDENTKCIEKLNDGLENFFSNITKSHANERMWTCYKSHREKLVSHNVTVNHWVAYNTRATNKYAEIQYLAYMINRYPNPSLKHFFSQKGLEIDEDEFALSDCIQWIWRSRIRNFQDVLLYIPSTRMRNLLINYFDLENDEQIPSRRLKEV